MTKLEKEFERELTTLHEWVETTVGIELTTTKLLEIINEDNDLIREVQCGDWTDSCVRDRIVSDICQELFQMEYPTYGDTDEYNKAFWEKVNGDSVRSVFFTSDT